MNERDDREIEALLRRAADHLVRRGSQYREHPVVDAPAVSTTVSSRRVGVRVLVGAMVVVSAGIGGVWAAGAGSPSARLVPGSPTVGPSDTPTASDPALTDSTSGTDPVQPPESSPPWSGSDGSVPLPDRKSTRLNSSHT